MTVLRVTGGCQCGAVRYAAAVEPDGAHLCHCRMCQKAVGSYFAALVGGLEQDVTWTRGQPSAFHSSVHAERGFCAACGTPLFYRAVGAGRIAFTMGSLDDPERIKPAWQVGTERRMPWFGELAELRSFGETDANDPPDMIAAVRASNRQHPDHDTETWPAEDRT